MTTDLDPAWARLNHWLVLHRGCVRMSSFVVGMNRWQFMLKGTLPDGSDVHLVGSGATLLAAASDLLTQMTSYLTDPSFVATLPGRAGGGVWGGGGS